MVGKTVVYHGFLFTFNDLPICDLTMGSVSIIDAILIHGLIHVETKKVVLFLTLSVTPNSFQDARKFKPEVSSGFGVSHWEPHGFGIGCL